ncbi:MAG TPA: amidohydrolase [Terracidiphilus sp.]|nr:amidohydrolase [Terracidiphilus sp.]
MTPRSAGFFACLLSVCLPLAAQAPADLAASAQQQLPALTEIYKHLHQNPELSRHEEQTSAFLAGQLRKLGYTVTEHVGKYADGAQAFGVVAVLENGPGPRLMIRTDMDALPVSEKTGLDFASHVTEPGPDGQPVPVMHACGHDLHMTVLIGVAKEMAERKSQWHGTLMLIGQPAEEVIQGSAAMLADNLYQRFGKPDFIVAEHDSPMVPAGSIAIGSGPIMASATGLNLVIRGVGSHGSQPQSGKDPILLASEFVVVSQSIVSRQINPQEPAVLSVGTIHGGTKNNIIPDEVTLGMTLRTFSMEERDQIVADIRRTANGLAEAYGIPADRMPTLTIVESTPVTINDAAFAARLHGYAAEALGKERVFDSPPVMGSEDAGLFSLSNQIPFVMYWLGAADPGKLAESRKTGVPLPSLHSPLFAPDYQPAIPTGVTAMTAIALDILK